MSEAAGISSKPLPAGSLPRSDRERMRRKLPDGKLCAGRRATVPARSVARAVERTSSAAAPEPAAPRRQRLLAEGARSGEDVVRLQGHQLGVAELLDVTLTEPERLRVERLLEQRARESRIPEALVALGTAEDRTEDIRRALHKRVLGVCGEVAEDRHELRRRVVGKIDLTRETRPETRVRLEEPAH